MKLEFYQNGRQFFFITLAVEGRKKILAETAAIRSLDIRRSQAAAHAFRANCLAMNDLADALCRRG